MRAWILAAVLAGLGGVTKAQELPPLPTPADEPPLIEPLPTEQPEGEGGPMTNRRLARLLRKHFPDADVQGGGGVWRIELPAVDEPEPEDEIEDEEEVGPGAGDRLPPIVLVLTDERANRMRIMMPIRPFDPQNAEDLRLALIALHANYDRALDARYAIQDGVLWSVFIHPLRSLTNEDLAGAIRQVRGLRENTGTSYSSGELLFGGGVAPDEPPIGPSSDDPSRA